MDHSITNDVHSIPVSKDTRRRALIVLGMHRSGTSAITRIISLLGATLPKNVLGTGQGNDSGHWEPVRLYQLHDAMLAEAGSRWNDWRAFDPERLGMERIAFYRNEIRRVIAEEYGTSRLIVLKEPRICRFLPLIEAALQELDIEPMFVLIHRNPLAVVSSLHARDGLSLSFSGLLWLRHVLDAETSTRGKRRVFVSYENVLSDWRAVIDEISSALSPVWPRQTSDAALDISNHLSIDLQHHRHNQADIQIDPSMSDWIRETYEALRGLERDGGSSLSLDVLDKVRQQFNEASAHIGDPMFAELLRHEVSFLAQNRAVAEVADERLSEIGRLVAHQSGLLEKIDTLESDLSAHCRELSIVNSANSELTERLEKAGSDLRISDTALHALAGVHRILQRERLVLEGQTQILRNEQATTATLLRTTEESLQTVRREIDGYKQVIQTLNASLHLAETETTRLSTDAADAKKESARLLFKQTTASSRQRFLSEARSPFWQPIRLYPLNHLAQIANGETVATWHAETEDPQFELFWKNDYPLSPGHYVLKLRGGDTADEFHHPRLYFDTGSGFNDTESAWLNLGLRKDGTMTANFSLFLPTQRIRLDPRVAAGSFSLGQVKIRKISRLTYYGGKTRRLVRQHSALGHPVSVPLRKLMTNWNSNGLKGVAAELRELDVRSFHRGGYEEWIAKFDSFTREEQIKTRKAVEQLGNPPLISVLMPVYNTPEILLREAIDSVIGQIYENWELCIADDCSTKPHVRKILKRYASRDARIKVTYRPKNGHISYASNSALQLVTGEWLALLDHDDILRPHALAEIALEISRYPSAELIYSDEDKIDSKGKRYDPYFKPDFSRELFRSQNYFNHLTVHRTQNIRSIGGWRPGYEGSQDYDLNLRIVERIEPRSIRHIPKILYHWRAVEGSTAVSGSEKNYAFAAGLNALQDHVERMKLDAVVEVSPGSPFYRLRFFVPEPQPLVSLIIPTRDRVELLKGCIGSILQKTTYSQYEIIVVDNGSNEPETLDYFRKISRRPNVRVLPYDKPFNYSAINNFAVKHAKGSIVGLINNDVEVISPDWLTEMVSWAIQPDIGCVGAKLYYANDTMQHAGVVLGVGGVANHAHLNLPRYAPGYFGRAVVISNFSAVTAACLIVRKSVYMDVGGLNERDLTVAFNDVDFCLKVREAGFNNVWTPFAELYHFESVSRGEDNTPEKRERFVGEVNYMLTRWLNELQSDPYYSIRLSKERSDFSLSWSESAVSSVRT